MLNSKRSVDNNSEAEGLPDLLRKQAQLRPHAPALLALNRVPLTYQRLFGEVSSIVKALRSFGVGTQDRVAVLLPTGPEMALAFLGVSSGATCVPLNPALTESELVAYLSKLKPALMIISNESALAATAATSALGIPVVRVRPKPDAEAGIFTLLGNVHVEGNAVKSVTKDDIALLLHTSGTTSRPKLVPLTHANLLAAAQATCRAHMLNESDRRLNFMPLFHVQGLVGSVLASLVIGSSVICTPGFDPSRVLEWTEELEPTWFSASPTMHIEILGANKNRGITKMPSLRFIRSGSAPLPLRVRDELEQTFGIPVVESYGMTEAHQIASTPLPPGRHKPGTVGRAIGSEVAILGENRRILAVGGLGEILIRGPNVMRGYLDDPEANEAAFVEGWLRTGDMGRLDEEGYLTITGRLKEIINRGGEKISPREIDDVLMEHPSVREAVTFAVPSPILQEEVAAAVTLGDVASVGEPELRAFASRYLAPFKVPRRIVIVDEIPTGPTHKVQRRELAKQLGITSIGDEETGTASVVGEATPLEAALAAIWSSALGIQHAERDDDFFALGGDSLKGTRLLAMVRQVFLVELPPLSMYDEASTVATMAKLIEQLQDAVKSPARR